MTTPEKRLVYWRRNKRLIAILLGIWALVSLGGGILGVRWLNAITLGEVPLGFWIAQQGAIFVFVGIVFFYAWYMDRLDHSHGADREEDLDV